jgi:alpha-glucuronidase
MDRTVANGTGYIGQYSPEVATIYESLEKCPDNLLLFMHHVPYRHVLHSGKTVIQHIHESHYEGAAEAQTFPEQWRRLHGRIDDERYVAILARLQYQAGHSIVWRDAVCNWLLRESKIEDAAGRVGHHPDRIEAEAMSLDGYSAVDVVPWETASGGKAIVCPASKCTATAHFEGKPGWYDLGIQYFDQNNGASRFEVLVGNQELGQWTSDGTFPTDKPDGHSSTRRTFIGVALRPGDEIRIIGTPDRDERAPIDYIEIISKSPEDPI